jgi:hypothetical protein
MRTVNTTFLEIMFRLMVDMGIVQHGFRGYAPDVETGASKATTLLYTCSLISFRPSSVLIHVPEKVCSEDTFNPS